MPKLALKVGELHDTVRCLLVKAVRIYEGDETLLSKGTRSTLAELYRTEWKQGTSQALVPTVTTATNSDSTSTLGPGSTGMDVLAAAARHHRLQDGLHSQVSRLDIDPTADASESQNGNSQIPAVSISATLEAKRTNHEMYGENFSSQWAREVETTYAASSGPNLQGGESLQPVFWPRMDSCRPYEITTQSPALLHNAANYPSGCPDHPSLDIGTYTASTAPEIDASWPDNYLPLWFDGFEQTYNYE